VLFIIRDDDTSFFTDPEELAAIYSSIWDRIPISLGIIPFDVPSYFRGFSDQFYQGSEPTSVAANAKLVKFIRHGVQRGRFDILLHGFNHLYKVIKPVPYDPRYWIPEFLCADNLETKLRDGKALLESQFNCKIGAFIPPSNAINRHGLKALAKNHLDLVGTARVSVLLQANPLNAFWLMHNRWRRSFPYGIRNYIGHKQIRCEPLTPVSDWRELNLRLEDCLRKQGIYVIATHYWELGRVHAEQGAPLRELLLELIARARSLGAKFLTIRDVFASKT
jgi:hypothetical protein